MNERRQEVKTYIVDLLCPKCNATMYCVTSIVLGVYPPMYAHRCPMCGWAEQHQGQYPRIEYERIERNEQE